MTRGDLARAASARRAARPASPRGWPACRSAPAATALQRTPSSACSRATTCANAISAAFERSSPPRRRTGAAPSASETQTIAPPPAATSAGSAACVTRYGRAQVERELGLELRRPACSATGWPAAKPPTRLTTARSGASASPAATRRARATSPGRTGRPARARPLALVRARLALGHDDAPAASSERRRRPRPEPAGPAGHERGAIGTARTLSSPGTSVRSRDLRFDPWSCATSPTARTSTAPARARARAARRSATARVPAAHARRPHGLGRRRRARRRRRRARRRAAPAPPCTSAGRYSVHPRTARRSRSRALRAARAGRGRPGGAARRPAARAEQMEADLRELLATVQNPPPAGAARRRVRARARRPGRRFRDAPAAKRYHQAYRHGLLEHSLIGRPVRLRHRRPRSRASTATSPSPARCCTTSASSRPTRPTRRRST